MGKKMSAEMSNRFDRIKDVFHTEKAAYDLVCAILESSNRDEAIKAANEYLRECGLKIEKTK